MPDWTTPADLRARLTRRWERGSWLSALARGEDFDPVDAKIAGPKAADVNSRRAEVTAWIAQWHDQARRPETDVSYRTVGGRGLTGANQLPDRLRICTLADLEQFLRVSSTQYRDLLDRTDGRPELFEWVAAHPMRALEHRHHFKQILSALDWIVTNAGSGRRLREIDAVGVDTKFVENNQRILLELGRLIVPHDLVKPDERTIAGRFGFATGDRRVRLRRLDDQIDWPLTGFDDVEVRTVDLAAMPLQVREVYIVENLTTYLSFPAATDAVAIFGGGYSANSAGELGWLRDREVVYWGDLDTHGFAILDRLRVVLPEARSIRMDTVTLLEHRSLWGSEPSQVTRELPNLTTDEARCYRDLVEDAHGHNLRLEQERLPLPAIGLDGQSQGHCQKS